MGTGRGFFDNNHNSTQTVWQSSAASAVATTIADQNKPIVKTVIVQQFVQAATSDGNSHFDDVCDLFKNMQLETQFRQQTVLQANIIAGRVEADLAKMHAVQPAATPEEQERRLLIAYVFQAYVRCLELDVEKWRVNLKEKNLSPDIQVTIKNKFQHWEDRQASIPAYKAIDLQQPKNMTAFEQLCFLQLALNYWRSSYQYIRDYEKLLNCEMYSKEEELWRYEQTTLCYMAAATGQEIFADINSCRITEPVNAQPANGERLSVAAIQNAIAEQDQRVQLRR